VKVKTLTLMIGLILIITVAIEGFYIFDLRKQINDEEFQPPDSVNYQTLRDGWFNRNDDNLFNLFSDLDNMQREMDHMFGQFSLDFRGNPHFDSIFRDYTSSPSLDFMEKDGNYVIEVELPGARDNTIAVSIENGMLNIRAETSSHQEKDKSNYIRSERYSGKLQRSLSLPPDADADKMTTKLENGVLTITIPKLS